LKLKKSHIGPKHLSRIQNGEAQKQGEGNFIDANLFKVQVTQGYLEEEMYLIQHGQAPQGMDTAKR